MPLINQVDQTRAEQVILFRWARAVLHLHTEIAGFAMKSYKTLQAEARKTVTVQCKIAGMEGVQGELRRSFQGKALGPVRGHSDQNFVHRRIPGAKGVVRH